MLRNFFLGFAFCLGMVLSVSVPAEAGGRCSNPTHGDSDYQKQCGIWLCLPDGFKQSDCKPMQKAFLKRLGMGFKKPCSPHLMPDYSRCTGQKGFAKANLGRTKTTIQKENNKGDKENKKIDKTRYIDVTYPDGSRFKYTYWERDQGYIGSQ